MTASISQPQSGAASHAQAAAWVEVMVEFDRSAPADGEPLSRGERYRQRRDAAEHNRQELEAWLDREGLRGEVKDIGAANAFDLLFARATPQAAEAMQNAPGVVAVTPAGELSH